MSNRAGGITVSLIGILVLFHWYFAHLIKYFAGDQTQLVPELGIAVFALFAIGGLMFHRKLIKG